ncbi:MAG: hypothetical protein HXY47_05150 [Nitrospirae bacterium]|nr:hypothetical protein [Nitrospirota bacterium]
MRPFIIGIGGAHSKAGKTEVACKLLKKLACWGAIKFTKTLLYSSIVDTPDVLREEDKDTRRLLDAGARSVLWVKSAPHEVRETIEIALERLSHLNGIIIEGNSAIDVSKPEIVVFVSKNEEIKKSAERILKKADVVIFDTNPPDGIPEYAKKFNIDDEQGYINFILRLIKEKQKLD